MQAVPLGRLVFFVGLWYDELSSSAAKEGGTLKKKTVWKGLLIAGICPFVIPFLIGVYRMSIESWYLLDWLILYSFVYWPTYLVGFIAIVISSSKLLAKESP